MQLIGEIRGVIVFCNNFKIFNKLFILICKNILSNNFYKISFNIFHFERT